MISKQQKKFQAVSELVKLAQGNQIITLVASLPSLVERFNRVHQNEEMEQVAADFEAFVRGELQADGPLPPFVATLPRDQTRLLKERVIQYLTRAKMEAESQL